MANLQWTPDFHHPGVSVVTSDSPAVLAAVPQTLNRAMCQPGDAMAVWALHPHEQDSVADVAYSSERSELGLNAQVRVMELARPRQQNVVWIDRYHLLANSANPEVAHRLLGLYVGSPGEIAIYVHHPSVTAQLAASLEAFPNAGGRDWCNHLLISQCRWAAHYAKQSPGAVSVAIAPAFVAMFEPAMQELAAAIAGM